MALPKVHPGYHLLSDGLPTAIGMFCVGFCASAFILLIRAMVADVVDEVKLETRRDLTTLMFSMVTTTTKVGQAVTVAIVFPILALVGYNGAEGAVNTKSAIFGLEMCYLFRLDHPGVLRRRDAVRPTPSTPSATPRCAGSSISATA